MSQSSSASAFVGSVPVNYDAHLGPMFFLPYAQDLAERAAASSPSKVLETAAGTGIVTEQLRSKLPNATIIATDLNPAMIERANAVRPGLNVEWRPADATDLPFDDGSFDVVVCQFGVMFFPDKQQAFNEAFRVLKPGGTFLFNIWESPEKNDVSLVTKGILATEFEGNIPPFLETPYGYSDVQPFKEMLVKGGFEASEPLWLTKECRAESAQSAAIGIVEGTPMTQQIIERNGDVARIRERVATTLAERYGASPMVAKMEAIVFQARKPG